VSWEPTSLYPQCYWNQRVLKKLVLERKLSPISVGIDEELDNYDECPICFLYYFGGLNRTRCCKKEICTECYIQIQKPDGPRISCPFCKMDNLSVRFVGPKSTKERREEEEEEEQYRAAERRMRETEIESDKARMEKALAAKAAEYVQSVPSPQIAIQPQSDVLASFESMSPLTPEMENLMLLEAIRLSLGNSVDMDSHDNDSNYDDNNSNSNNNNYNNNYFNSNYNNNSTNNNNTNNNNNNNYNNNAPNETDSESCDDNDEEMLTNGDSC